MATSLFAAVWHGRCPACGRGTVFKSHTEVAEKCPACGWPCGKADIGDGASFVVLSLLCVVLVPIILLVAFRVDWPVWLHAIIWSVVCLAAGFGLLRPVKALFIALQHRHRPGSFFRDDLNQT